MCKSRNISRNALPSKPLDLGVDSSGYYFNEGFTISKPNTKTEDNVMSLVLGSGVNTKILVNRDSGVSSMALYSGKVSGTPSCRRIPCKARGVSSKHVPENAYFDIPANAPHGLLLSCSNIECARSIRRFRYCRVCASPVSKRNFVSRHGHGVIHSAKEVKTEVDEVYGSVVDASNLVSASPFVVGSDAAPAALLRTTDDLVNTRNDINQMARPRIVSLEQLNNLEKYNQKQQGVCGTYRRIPCRARCMPKNHTPETAYFEIPLDAKHGMLLSCSMQGCRDQMGGPRFRYCQVCEQPVAKRNFSKRHSHGILYLARRWGDRTDRLLSCQEISDCATTANSTPISTDHSVDRNAEKGTNNPNQQMPLLVPETHDSSQHRTNPNQERRIEAIEPKVPPSEVATNGYVLPWIPPLDQPSRVLTSTEWESTIIAPPATPQDQIEKRLLAPHAPQQQPPERTLRCATPSPPNTGTDQAVVAGAAAAATTTVSYPLFLKVVPPWIESVAAGRVMGGVSAPDPFDAFMEDGIDFSAIFDHDDDEESGDEDEETF